MADNIITAVKGGRFSEMNGTMLFLLMYMCFCSFNFGYDVGNFGSVQGMQAFGRQFGTCDKETGNCSLQPWLSSVMTSVPFIGKALGTVTCGVIAERWGRKIAIMGLIIASFVGVLLQTTATTAAQFTIGRFISFAMTGMTIVVVPIYQAETAPRALRGLVTSSLQLMINLGALVASLVTWRTSSMNTNAAWHIPVGLQFLAPTFLLVLWFWVPESPRWLLAKDRVQEATKSLRRIRKDKSEEDIEFEIQAIQHTHSNDHKGRWSELFDAENRRRTMVAILAMFGQQITGQAFASQYSVIFYLSQGFGARSFIFSVVGSVVASFILFPSCYALSWAPVSYIVLSEAASSHIKEKTNLLASVISVLTTFATSFTLPYLLSKPYAGLGAKVGFIYGSFCVAMVVLAYFFIPELKGRSLEEVDQLFASGQPLRKLGSLETRTAEEAFESDSKQQPRTEVKELV
ncbi:Hexose transporter 2 [Fusarium oxysporum f. sp. raphani]|uniref:Hexose transporter 2 n=1 Tax=Fusarium oxysporum f. sp. raphani TaxID=96318 RepID=A0A8J5PR51_FUSOX|nr:Hexose transporter 2 [Fusarium oxysporum f. sp. raphani]